MPQVEVTETVVLDESAGTRYTKEGYLVAMPRVARTGIQIYRGDELGKPEMTQVRVYRPEDQVFSQDALKSYAHRPVTNGHPPVPVTADNWKQYAAGQTGDEVVRDGTFVRVPMVLMDAAAIKEYKAGKRELSQGYAMDLHWESGKTADGQDYDAVMRTIRQNHLALVGRARGGPKLRLGDGSHESWQAAFDEFVEEFSKRTQTGDEDMNMTRVMIGDQSVEVADVSAQHVLRTITGLETELAGLRSKLEKDKEEAKKAKDEALAAAKTAADAIIATKDAEITTLKDAVEKAKPSPAALNAMVVELFDASHKAKTLLGDKAPDFKDKSVADIRRAAVDGILGDKAKGWSDDAVKASFDTLAAQIKDTGNGNDGRDPIRQTFQSRDAANVTDTDKAWRDMNKDLSEAWKTKTSN